jgi:hypothetical protein
MKTVAKSITFSLSENKAETLVLLGFLPFLLELI